MRDVCGWRWNGDYDGNGGSSGGYGHFVHGFDRFMHAVTGRDDV
jgi:hypothetical protein